MQTKKKIFYLTSNIGGGHMAAAKAISEALDSYYPDQFEHEFVDVLTLLGPSLDKLIAKMHSISVSYAKITYKAFFELTDKSNIANYFDKYGYHLIKQRLKPIVDSNPDIIISSFPFLTYSVSRYLKAGDTKTIKLVSVITDTGEVHSAWISKHVDYYIAPTVETSFHLEGRGIPKDKILTFGLPLRRGFYNEYNIDTLKEKYTLPPNNKIVLYLMGAWGTGSRTVNKLAEIDNENDDICIVVICGQNKRLMNKINKFRFKNKIIAKGFIDNVSEWIALSDVVITKAGGASIMEAVRFKKPIIVSEVLPGQEKPNAKFVQNMGFGYVETSPTSIATRVKFLFTTGDIDRIKNNYKYYNIGDGADKNISDFVNKLVNSTKN